MPKTGSPGANRVTPNAVASTTPATSHPRMNGGSPSPRLLPPFVRVFQSTGLTPAASTRTRTSVGSGSGLGTSTSSSTSGPPSRETCTARTEGVRPLESERLRSSQRRHRLRDRGVPGQDLERGPDGARRVQHRDEHRGDVVAGDLAAPAQALGQVDVAGAVVVR